MDMQSYESKYSLPYLILEGGGGAGILDGPGAFLV